MSHVTHQHSSRFICNLPKLGIIPFPWVRTPAANKNLGAKIKHLLLKLIVIDITCMWVHFIRQILKEYGSSRDLLPTRSVIPVTQMPARRGIQPHYPIIWEQKTSENCEIRRGTRVWLNIHTPFLRVEMKRRQCAIMAEQFNLINMLIPSVVPSTRHSLRVLIRQVTTQSFHHSPAHEILRSNQFNPFILSLLLFLHNRINFRVRHAERLVPPRPNRGPSSLEPGFSHGDSLRSVLTEQRISRPLQTHWVTQNAEFLIFALIFTFHFTIFNLDSLFLLLQQLQRNLNRTRRYRIRRIAETRIDFERNRRR
jgi:hypothetical protein